MNSFLFNLIGRGSPIGVRFGCRRTGVLRILNLETFPRVFFSGSETTLSFVALNSFPFVEPNLGSAGSQKKEAEALAEQDVAREGETPTPPRGKTSFGDRAEEVVGSGPSPHNPQYVSEAWTGLTGLEQEASYLGQGALDQGRNSFVPEVT